MKIEKMIDKLIEEEIEDIKTQLNNEDYEYINAILRGEGFEPYNERTDEEIKSQYEELE